MPRRAGLARTPVAPPGTFRRALAAAPEAAIARPSPRTAAGQIRRLPVVGGGADPADLPERTMASVNAFEPRPAEGLNHPNVVAMLHARVSRGPELTALRYRERGTWRALSWSAWWEQSRAIAAALVQELGVQPGDRVALMSGTRYEWVLLDAAIAMAGAVSVPIYPSTSREDGRFVLADAGCTVWFAEHPEHVRRLLGPPPRESSASASAMRMSLENEAAQAVATSSAPEPDPELAGWPLRAVVLLDTAVEVPRARGGGRVTAADVKGLVGALTANADATSQGAALRSLSDLLDSGRAALADSVVSEKLDAEVDRDRLLDPFTLVYTSGTTGRPKGAVLLHRNMVYEAWAIKNTFAVDPSDTQLVVLPLAQIFARHMIWVGIESGTVAAFARSLDAVADGLREVAPTFMGGVPRMYEKMQARIQQEISARGAVFAQGFAWALGVGRRVRTARARGQSLGIKLEVEWQLANRVFLAPVAAQFGGRIRFFIAGAAPLVRDTAEFFAALGEPLLEGYGLTETTGATHVNRPERQRVGTVGPALPGCEVAIASDGEVLIRGHNVMQGYWNAPEATAEVIDERGWLHTGDIGEVSDGFLRITDRKKDLIVTAGGKNVAPQKIESRLMAQAGIAHAMVVGDKRPFLVALVTLDEAELMALSVQEGLGCRSYADLVRHPRIRRHVQAAVDRVNTELASYETVKRFAIPPSDFTETTGELTPTMKVKRRVVRERYRDLIDSMYEQPR